MKVIFIAVLPGLRQDLASKLSLPQRADYYRVALLSHYGGIWLDADTIVMRDLTPLLRFLRFYEFVGFGCHYGPLQCQRKPNGYPFPANWVMVARANSPLLALYQHRIDHLLDIHNQRFFQSHYHILGRESLRESIVDMHTKQRFWDYKHVSSRCVERDSHNEFVENKRFISTESVDEECLSSRFFMPIYNTAPGFPKWFRQITADELLQSEYLLSKMFRLALQHV